MERGLLGNRQVASVHPRRVREGTGQHSKAQQDLKHSKISNKQLLSAASPHGAYPWHQPRIHTVKAMVSRMLRAHCKRGKANGAFFVYFDVCIICGKGQQLDWLRSCVRLAG